MLTHVTETGVSYAVSDNTHDYYQGGIPLYRNNLVVFDWARVLLSKTNTADYLSQRNTHLSLSLSSGWRHPHNACGHPQRADQSASSRCVVKRIASAATVATTSAHR